MRLSPILLVLLAAGLVAACAGSVGPGLGPSQLGETEERPGYRGQGVYVLTSEEQHYDCKQLAFVLGKLVQQINALPDLAVKQRDQPPATVELALGRLSGGGLPALDDLERDQARANALGKLGRDKKCPPVDVEAQTKAASDKVSAFRKI